MDKMSIEELHRRLEKACAERNKAQDLLRRIREILPPEMAREIADAAWYSAKQMEWDLRAYAALIEKEPK